MKKQLLLPAACMLFGIITCTNAFSQNSIIMPTINENALTNFGTDGYPNSSTINYQPYCGCGGPRQLTAMVADDGTNPPLVFVNDQVCATIPWPNATIPSGPGSSPDVIVGNDLLNPGWYIAGVVGISGGNVSLYLYHIKNVGTMALSITGPYSIIPISSTGAATGPAHIDAIAESSNPYLGFAVVNKYVITWTDATGIMAYYGALDGSIVPSTVTVNGGATMSSPDVAAVERINSVGNYEDVALFSFVSLPNKLFYAEWNMTTGTVSAATVYDNLHTFANPNPGTVSVARIDAIDDYTLNSPTGTNAYFVITAAAPAPGTSIWEYNNITGPLVANNITSSITLPNPGLFKQTNTIPVVACGPGPYYSVGYYSLPAGSGGGQQGYFVTAIDRTTGLPLASDPNAYMINKQGYDPAFAPGLALSATSNDNSTSGQQLFAGWENYAFLYSKYSQAAPYVYKHSAQTTTLPATADWQLYPNPAYDVVTLTAPAGFKTTDATYHIADISGRVLLSGAVASGNQEINVSNLPAGMYLLNVYSSEGSKTIKFVK